MCEYGDLEETKFYGRNNFLCRKMVLFEEKRLWYLSPRQDPQGKLRGHQEKKEPLTLGFE